jgi:hypothetical protein
MITCGGLLPPVLSFFIAQAVALPSVLALTLLSPQITHRLFILLVIIIHLTVLSQAFRRPYGCLLRPSLPPNLPHIMCSTPLHLLLSQDVAPLHIGVHIANLPYRPHLLTMTQNQPYLPTSSLRKFSVPHESLYLPKLPVPLPHPESLALPIYRLLISDRIRSNLQERTRWRHRYGKCMHVQKQHYLMHSEWRILPGG